MVEKSRLIISIDNIVAILFAIGLYIKEFYILPSGSLQIGDLLLLFAFAICLLAKRINLQHIDAPLFVFTFLAILINFIYYIVLTDSSFMKYSLYLLFSVIVVLLSRDILYNDIALKYSSFALKAALITQLVVRILGRGRFFFGRYSGTFNDPNQFGYYILMCVFSIYVISFLREEKQQILWIILGGFLITISQSSGMLLGFTIFFALYIWRVTGDQTNILKYFARF